MKKTLPILLLLLLFSCDNSEYKTIDFGSFEITVPRNWKKYEQKGIDSYVGGLITNEEDTLSFDLGWYSGDLTRNMELLVFNKTEYSKLSKKHKSELENVKHLIVENYFTSNYDPKDYHKYDFIEDSVNCFGAKFIFPRVKGFGYSGIFIDSLKGDGETEYKTSMSFYGRDLSDATREKFFNALKNMRLTKYCN